MATDEWNDLSSLLRQLEIPTDGDSAAPNGSASSLKRKSPATNDGRNLTKPRPS